MAETAKAPRDARVTLIAVGVLLAIAVAIFVIVRINQQREDATRIDTYFCTLSGVGPMDRGQETGRLCADLLHDAGLPGY